MSIIGALAGDIIAGLELLDLLPEVLRAKGELLTLGIKGLFLPIQLHGAEHSCQPSDVALVQAVGSEGCPQHLRPSLLRAGEGLLEEVVEACGGRGLVLATRVLRVGLAEGWVRGNGLDRQLDRAALQQHLLEAHLLVLALRLRGRGRPLDVLRHQLLHPRAVELCQLRRHAGGSRALLEFRLDLDDAGVLGPDMLADLLHLVDRGSDHVGGLFSQHTQGLA
mmetsp:Transcript_54712/g.138160  ORF Transcript_54712/g.138160 Transcript_54712/m.138160 type:complete len:222 (-) Transcript_54712:102-767(-)